MTHSNPGPFNSGSQYIPRRVDLAKRYCGVCKGEIANYTRTQRRHGGACTEQYKREHAAKKRAKKGKAV